MTAKQFAWLWLLLALLPACTTPYLPELKGFEDLLVVDGSLTDAPGPYVVTLNISGGISNREYLPETGAKVYIKDKQGAVYQLLELRPGSYHSDSAAFRGEAGKSYQLQVYLADGRNYESPFTQIPVATEIDTINSEVAYRYYDELKQEIPGYQFYVNAKTAATSKAYYLWMMVGTYKYSADFTLDFVYNGVLRPFPDPYKYQICYRTYPVEEFTTGNTANLVEARIQRKPLFFLRGDDIKLLKRYSLLVRQLTVDEATQQYWESARQQSAAGTSLYNVQPYQLRGNVVNLANDQEIVLGYFLVAGEDQQRVFVDRPTEFPLLERPCALDYEGYGLIFDTEPAEWPIYVTQPNGGGRAVSGRGCINCEEKGGSIIPPEWWYE